MIRHQTPGIDSHGTLLNYQSKTVDEMVTIPIVQKDPSSFNPPANHMMQNARGI